MIFIILIRTDHMAPPLRYAILFLEVSNEDLNDDERAAPITIPRLNSPVAIVYILLCGYFILELSMGAKPVVEYLFCDTF